MWVANFLALFSIGTVHLFPCNLDHSWNVDRSCWHWHSCVFGPGLCSGPAICIAACSRRYRWCDVRACCYVSIVSTSPLFTSISEFLSLHFELNQANKPFSHFFSFQMLCYLCSLFVLAAFIVTAVIVTRSLVTRFFKLISSQVLISIICEKMFCLGVLAGAAFNNLSCAGFPTWGHTDRCFFLGCVADKWTLSACICCILLACCLGTFLFLSLEPTRLQELEGRNFSMANVVYDCLQDLCSPYIQ